MPTSLLFLATAILRGSVFLSLIAIGINTHAQTIEKTPLSETDINLDLLKEMDNPSLPHGNEALQKRYFSGESTEQNLLEGAVNYSRGQVSLLQERLKNEKNPKAADVFQYWIHDLTLLQMSPEAMVGAVSSIQSKVLSDKLRKKALLQLGKMRSWVAFMKLYPNLSDPSPELLCYRILLDVDSGAKINLWKDNGLSLWKQQPRAGEACRQVFFLLMEDRKIAKEEINYRARQWVFANQRAEFLALPAWAYPAYPKGFNSEDFFKDDNKLADIVYKNLSILKKNKTAEKYRGWMLLSLSALVGNIDSKSSDKQIRRTLSLLDNMLPHLSADERKIAAIYAGMAGLTALAEESVALLSGAHKQLYSELSTTDLERVLRLFLRYQAWQPLVSGIEALPSALQKQIQWRYWWARGVLELTGQRDASADNIKAWLNTDLSKTSFHKTPVPFAVQTLKAIASEEEFYGAIASEWLGQEVNLVSAPLPSHAEMQNIEKNDCLQWAIYLNRLGGSIRALGVLEWRECLANLNDRQKIAAAKLAISHHLFDRAINAAGTTKNEQLWDYRFLMPYRQVVTAYAEARRLSVSWVYGLMRQESRFVMNAASHVGAQGLMQVMPKTGQWLAKKMAIANYTTTMLSDINTNVNLGTYYMQLLFDRFSHPAIVSAAYNAGPGRAQRWRPTKGKMDAAIYAETIPFTETRGYVKNVLWNTFIYDKLTGKSNAKISDWLMPVTAGDTAVEDLP